LPSRLTRPSPIALLLALITLLAAVLRFQHIGLIEHNVDHAYPIWQALMTLDQGRWPLLGQGTSVLFANPPLTGYLYLPVVALFRSPLAVYGVVIALNSLAVPLAYAALRPLIQTPAALAAAFLIAVNPWVIEYSRTSWVQSLLPFFACLLAWLVYPVLAGAARNPGRRVVLTGIAAALAVNTYLLAYLFLAQIGLLAALFRRRMPKRALLVATVIVAVPALVYAGALLADPAGVSSRLQTFGDGGLRVSGAALEHALRLASGAEYPLARGAAAPEPWSGFWALVEASSALLAWVVVAALAGGVVRALRARIKRLSERDAALILLVWFGLPIMLMTVTSQVVHPFYLLLTLPAGAGLAGWGAAWLFEALRPRSPRRLLWAAAAVIVALFAAAQTAATLRYALETATIPGAHGLGALPVEAGLALGVLIDDDLPPGGTVMADVDAWTLISLAGRTFPFLRDARAPAVTILPASGGLVVAAQPPDAGRVAPEGSVGQRALTLADGVELTVDRLPPAPSLPADAAPLAAPGEQGIALEGWALNALGDGQFALQTWWRVTDPAAGADRLFAPFAHIFDADGARIAVVDGQAIPSFAWRTGDLHAHRMLFTAEQPFTLAVGQYDGAAGENVIFTLPDGAASALIPLPAR
jgi:4-amino-4-deoxy-L-arabinose transferase-like glycosyltransferase